MNEQEMEVRLERLARSGEDICAPEPLRRFMRSLEAGTVEATPVIRGARRGRFHWGLPGLMAVRAAATVAVTALIAGALLIAVVPAHSSPVAPPTPVAGPTFSASSWSRLYSFPASSGGFSQVTGMRQSDGLIYGLVARTGPEQQSARWGNFTGAEYLVAQSADGRNWTLGEPLSDPVLTMDLPPMDATAAYRAIAKHGSRWVVVGGVDGAPAAVAISDGNQPVESIGMAWVSDDGLSWRQPSSARFPGYKFTNVAATSWGFIATGSRADSTGFGVWTSSDGVDWQVAVEPTGTSTGSVDIEFDPAGGYLAIAADAATTDGATGSLKVAIFHSGDGHEWTQAKTKLNLSLGSGVQVVHENGAWTINISVYDGPTGTTPDGQVTYRAHLEGVTSPDGLNWTPTGSSAEFTASASLYSVAVRHGSETLGFIAPDQVNGMAPVAGLGVAVPAPAVPDVPVPAGTAAPGVTPVAPGSNKSSQAIRVGRTDGLSGWTSAGTGPIGIPTDAVALPDRLLLFVSRSDAAAGTEWVEVWSAPWP